MRRTRYLQASIFIVMVGMAATYMFSQSGDTTPPTVSLSISSASVSTGPTYNAATCNFNDVNAVINGPTHTAVDGDIIKIPAGSCTWTSSLHVTKGISIIGAGSSSTIIQDGMAGTVLAVNIPSATSSTFRWSGMTFNTSGASGTLVNIQGTCNSTTCSHIRIDNMKFTGNFGGFTFQTNNVFGVIDHNFIDSESNEFITMAHSSYGGLGTDGDNSWAQPDSFGTDNALYIEANTFTSAVANYGPAMTDTEGGGGRFVARFNTVTNRSFQTHGTESSGRLRGGRQYEIYNNSMTLGSGGNGDVIGWRSGTGLVFNNTLSGPPFQSVISIANYRDDTNFYAFSSCTGLGPNDNNTGTVYDSGTFTTTSLSSTTLTLTNSTKSWTTNQWAANPPYTIVDITKTDSNGFHPGAQILSNTGTVITSKFNSWGANLPSFDAGDSYQILRATLCIDQAGRGGNGATFISGNPPSPAGWVNEPLDPIYEWGDAGSTPAGGWVKSQATRIIANRDYYYQNASFNGTSGTGTGTLAGRPATCTTGVGYWATDQGNWNHSGAGGQGQLYVCTATNTWTLYYTPYTYPHPLTTQ